MAHWQYIESREYTAQLQAIGDIKRLDERLRGLTIALWTHADTFAFALPGNPRPPGISGRLRIATLPAFNDELPLTVWFEIDETGADPCVIMRWIESGIPAEGTA